MRLRFLRLFREFRDLEDAVETADYTIARTQDKLREWQGRYEELQEHLVIANSPEPEPEPEKPAPPKRRTMRDIQRAKVAQTRAANADLLRKKQSKAQEK